MEFDESSSHVASLRFREIVVNALEPLAEMQNGVALAREERVHADAGAGGDFPGS